MIDVRDAFAMVAYRYRRCERIGAAGTAVFGLSIALSFVWGSVPVPVVIIAFGGWITTLAAFFSVAKLACPICKESIFLPSGDGCPCCGQRSLTAMTLTGRRSCTSCHRTFRYRRKGRVSKIRFCTSCSACLDDRGI
jgi:hypothetical protein